MKPKTSKQKGFNHLKLIKNTELIDLSLINLYQSVQSRTGFNLITLSEYIEVWESGSKFPPVDLYFDGQTYWIGDGFHRIKSRLEANLKGNKIEAIVHKGTKRDATLHSVGANSDHGLPRTNEDKRHAVELLLRDDEWSKWSNCEIARKACVSEFLVRSIRASMFDLIEGNESDKRLVKRKGKVFEQKIDRIGKSGNQTISLPENNADELISHNIPQGICGTTGYAFEHVRLLLIQNLSLFPEVANEISFRSIWRKAFGCDLSLFFLTNTQI